MEEMIQWLADMIPTDAEIRAMEDTEELED